MLSKKPKRRRQPIKQEKEKPVSFSESKKDLNFSYSASRDYTTFGFGSYGDKALVTTEDIRLALDRAFKNKDVKQIRALSRHFFKVSGVYSSAAQYLAFLPTYDYMITPRVFGIEVGEESITREVVNQLLFLENMHLKESLKSISLDVIVDGVSYVYMRRQGKKAVLQKLPVEYCRTKNSLDGFPVVEFNLQYIEEAIGEEEKAKKLNSLPPEIVYEYNLWKNNNYPSRRRLNSNSSGFNPGTWIVLDPKKATAFYFYPSKQPILANSFFAILDLMELKGIEKKKAENELYNLVVQKFKFTDDDEPILELPDMQAFHESAKKIFEGTSQTDLLTTLADIQNINLNEAAAAPIDFTPWNKSVYGELGISSQLFSTEGNMALEKSIIVDESLIFTIVDKYQNWLNMILKEEFSEGSEKYRTNLSFPPITTMNRNELAQKYKDLATLGYSKVLPALAMGQSQLDVLSVPIFENSILNLSDSMEPLQSSHTASAKEGGRPPLPDSQKSEKTIQNGGG